MAVTIRIKRGTTTQWNASTTPLVPGELGYDLTTKTIKIGDGTTLWNDLDPLNKVEIDEISQDAIYDALTNFVSTGNNITVEYNDAENYIILDTGPNIASVTDLANYEISANEYTDEAVASLGNQIGESYVPVSLLTQPDGVATLDSSGYVPDNQISPTIARDSEIITSYNDLTDKPIIELAAVKWTANHYQLPGGENTRYLAGDIVWDGGNIYVANFDNESLPTTNTQYWSLVGPGKRLNIDGRDIPNIIWSNILDKPTLFDGSYNSLTNLPTLFDGNYNSLTNLPTLFDGDYDNLTNTPTLFSGSYNDLTNKPNLFSGSYTDLTNKPVFSGTSNEVEVSTVGGTTTIGFPNNITISGNIIISTSPTLATHAVNKAYVDNITAGLHFHAAAHCASTTNLNATYNNGSSGVGATLTNAGTNAVFILDNHAVELNERVLIKDQTDAKQNGIYVVTVLGDASTPWVLTRATDADNSPLGEVSYGDFIFIQQGTHGGIGYVLNTTGSITLGTSNLSYTQFTAGQTVIAGNGITEISPGIFGIDTTITVDLNTAQTLTNKTITGSFTGNLTGNADTVTNGVYTSGTYSDPTWLTISKSYIGLGNVDNTSDADKPISTATQTSLDSKLSTTDASVDYYITNVGAGAYSVNGVSNGLIYLSKGKKYRIVVNAPGHPFWIQTVSGGYSSGNIYNSGITNNGTANGSILVELPSSAPNDLYYACQFHASMSGGISVGNENTVTINSQSSNYTLIPNDSNRLIEMSGGGTLTISDSSSFPVGFMVDVLQTGSSQVTIAGNGFTPNATPGLKLRAQWSSATLVKRALNSWVVLGDLSA